VQKLAFCATNFVAACHEVAYFCGFKEALLPAWTTLQICSFYAHLAFMSVSVRASGEGIIIFGSEVRFD
jgi:hypothetical protein